MSLMKEWNDYVEHMTDDNLDEFKEKYYAREEDLYKVILAQHGTPVTGKFPNWSNSTTLSRCFSLALWKELIPV